MTLEELMAKLESDEIKEAVTSLINAEKERGLTSYRKKDQELLGLKTSLKSKGFDPEKGNLQEWLDGKIAAETRVQESSLTIAQLNDRLSEVQGQWENEKKTAKNSKIQAELTSKIGSMFYGSDYMIKSWLSDGKLDLVDGNITYDGKPFDSALETIKSENKGSIKVTQVPGSGVPGGAEKQMSSDEDKFIAQLLNK